MPLLRFAADLAPSKPIGMDRRLLDVFGHHLSVQIDRRRDRRLRVDFREKILKVGAQQFERPSAGAELSELEIAEQLAQAMDPSIALSGPVIPSAASNA